MEALSNQETWEQKPDCIERKIILGRGQSGCKDLKWRHVCHVEEKVGTVVAGAERARRRVEGMKLNVNALGGFPGGAVVENLPSNAGDTGLSPGLGRSHMPRSSWARPVSHNY